MQESKHSTLKPSATRPKPLPTKKLPTDLPIVAHMTHIVRLVKDNPITMICASTGSGKSSVIPPYLVQSNPDYNVLVISPTVISCVQLAKRVRSQYPDMKVETACGGKVLYNESTRLAFATSGHVKLLLARTHRFAHFNVVLFDEAHVRSVENEVLTAICHYLYLKLQHIKFLVMTATLDPGIIKAWQLLCTTPIPKLQVDVVLFPIMETFEETEDPDVHSKHGMECLQASSIEYLVKQNAIEPKGHFLVFCPGQEIIDEMYDSLMQHPKLSNCTIFRAFASLPFEELELAFNQHITNRPERAIILATDVAETSVTIPGVVLVLDMGLQKNMNFGVLEQVKVSKFSSIQRRGRTGRTGKGHVHRMYTQSTFDSLEMTYSPALLRTHIHQSILELIIFKLNPYDVLALADMDSHSVRTSITSLVKAELLSLPIKQHQEPAEGDDEKGEEWKCGPKIDILSYEVSKEAMHIASLPVRLELGSILYKISSWQDEYLQSLVKLVVSICEIESGGGASLIYLPKRQAWQTKEEYMELLDSFRLKHIEFELGSCCALNTSVNAVTSFLKQGNHRQSGKWCMDHGLNNKVLAAITALLFRLDPKAAVKLLSAGGGFKHIIPIFKSSLGTDYIYELRQRDRWFHIQCFDMNNFCLMNRRGFRYEDPECGKVLAINISSVQSAGRTLRFLTTTMPLAEDEQSDSE